MFFEVGGSESRRRSTDSFMLDGERYVGGPMGICCGWENRELVRKEKLLSNDHRITSSSRRSVAKVAECPPAPAYIQLKGAWPKTEMAIERIPQVLSKCARHL